MTSLQQGILFYHKSEGLYWQGPVDKAFSKPADKNNTESGLEQLAWLLVPFKNPSPQQDFGVPV